MALPKTIPPHPFSEIFAIHDGDSIWKMADDIKENGQLEKGVTYQGKLLDGRRRQLACIKAGVEFQTKEFKGTEQAALAYVVSRNLHRRHLGEAERAMAAAKIANLKQGQKKSENSDTPIGGSETTQAQAAEMLNVSERQVQRAATVIESGTEAVQQAVADGTLSISAASGIVDMPAKIQNQVVKNVRSGKAKTAAQAVRQLREPGDDTEQMEAERRAARQAKKNNGKPAFDDKKFDGVYGALVRHIEDRKRVFGDCQEYAICQESLSMILKTYKAWMKRSS